MAAQLEASSAGVLVARTEELAVEGRRIKSAEEMTLLEARCQVQLFENPGAVRRFPVVK